MKFHFSFFALVILASAYSGCKKEELSDPKLPVVNVTSSIINGATLNGNTLIHPNIAELAAGKYVVSGNYGGDLTFPDVEIFNDTIIITACGDSCITITSAYQYYGAFGACQYTMKTDSNYVFTGNTERGNTTTIYFSAKQFGSTYEPITIQNYWTADCGDLEGWVNLSGKKIH